MTSSILRSCYSRCNQWIYVPSENCKCSNFLCSTHSFQRNIFKYESLFVHIRLELHTGSFSAYSKAYVYQRAFTTQYHVEQNTTRKWQHSTEGLSLKRWSTRNSRVFLNPSMFCCRWRSPRGSKLVWQQTERVVRWRPRSRRSVVRWCPTQDKGWRT